MSIDYAAAKREMPKHKAALTRAVRSKDHVKVLTAVEKAFDAFDAWGAWPDQWHDWNIALWDAFNDFRHQPVERGLSRLDLDAMDKGDFTLSDRFLAAIKRAEG